MATAEFSKFAGILAVFLPIPKKGNAKECSNYHTIALISHASKVMLKILHAMWETWVRFLSQEDLLEEDMATHSSILA